MISCQSKVVHTGVPAIGAPIELSAAEDSEGLSRGVISNVSDLLNDGFAVWSLWAQDPDDSDVFTNDYSSGATNLVFGINGTAVYAIDTNEDGSFTPSLLTQDTWYYTPKRYWYRGTYKFVAALPASAFNTSYAMSNDENDYTGIVTGVLGMDGVLTLDFGEDENENPRGFDLSANQVDLMFAVADVDNCDENAAEIVDGVSLYFDEHSFTQIVIEAASIDENVDIIVDKLTFSGNHASTAGPIAVSFGEEGVILDYTIDQNSSTDSDNPFQVIDNIDVRLPKAAIDSDGNWQLSYDTIASGLLVFPEESFMTLEIEYRASLPSTSDVTSETITGTVTTSAPVTWLKGRKYVYKLQISQHRVDILGSSVMDWNEKRVDHTFN